jgi:DNA polymerase-3 subunit delta'
MIMNWDEIVGQQRAVDIIRAMLAADRMPHALLFSGPSGIGKALTAKLTAAGILCTAGGDKPCGCCQSCLLFNRGAHPDFIQVVPDGATIKIDQIRMLKSFAALTPSVGAGRVCLIEDAEVMTVQAANSILKLLEEPPNGLVFILTAGTGKPLLPTILSRCRKISFCLLPAAALEQALVQKGYAADTAAVIAHLSGGRMGKALALLAPDGLEFRDMALALLRDIQQQDMAAVWSQSSKLSSLAAKDLISVLEFFLYLLRDLLVVAGGYGEQLLYNIDLVQELAGRAADWPERRSMAAVTAVKNTMRALEGNANGRLALEDLLINLKDWQEKGVQYVNSSRYPL